MRGSDPFYRDTWVEVQLDAIEENIKNVRKRLPKQTAIIAVVKANAYGHGAYEVAKTALASGASGLAVAFLDEALALRNDGIRAPILVLGAARPQDAPIAAENAVSLTVFQTDWLTEARQHLGGQKLSVHIKCDTGMGRIGVRSTEELKAVEKLIESETCFSFDGIFTHFATADEIDTALYEKQYSRFREMVESLGTRPPFVHCANSAAALRFDQTPFNAVRLGIVMYGLAPSPEMKAILPFPLKEAFSLHTKVTHVKQIHTGDTVSYGATYTADQDEWIATLPIGYADGWIRKLQGQEVIVGGEKAPIVGRICMDQCMVKLPHAVPVGTEAVLIGRQGEYLVSVDEIAEKLETINYEVTCSISARVPRIFMQKGQKVTKVLNFLLAK